MICLRAVSVPVTHDWLTSCSEVHFCEWETLGAIAEGEDDKAEAEIVFDIIRRLRLYQISHPTKDASEFTNLFDHYVRLSDTLSTSMGFSAPLSPGGVS